MSDADDDDNSYGTNEDYNDDESQDDDQDDHDFAEEDYSITNSHFYDEENRQVMIHRNDATAGNHISDTSHNGKPGTTMSVQTIPNKPVPALRHAQSSYVSLIKHTEDEMEVLTRANQHHYKSHAANGTKGKITAKSRSQKAVTVLFRSTAPSRSSTEYKNPRQQQESLNSSYEADFPLRNIAAGVPGNAVSVQDARSLEITAKKKLKLLKADLQSAQMDVAEAKLAEFAAKLQARQIKIHEKHAKLCKRRALLKQAEQDQTALEKKLDDEEQDHRDRERRVRNRERRVKQDEAALRIKESLLRKREINITEGIEKIERWREIVDEKEQVQKQMEDILQKKEEIQGKSVRRGRIFSYGGRRVKSTDSKHKDTGAEAKKHDMLGNIISGIRRQQIEDHQTPSRLSVNGGSHHRALVNRHSPTNHDSEIKSGAPSIWL